MHPPISEETGDVGSPVSPSWLAGGQEGHAQPQCSQEAQDPVGNNEISEIFHFLTAVLPQF